MRKLLAIIIVLMLSITVLYQFEKAFADEEHEWILVETVDYPNDESWVQSNLHESFNSTYSCSPSNYSVTTSYIGRDEDWRNPPKVKGESITLNGTYSGVPQKMKAGEEVSLTISLTAAGNSLSFYTFWASGNAYFDVPEIKPGSKSRAAINFINDDEKSNFVIENANDYAAINETIKAIVPEGKDEGDQISIITTFYRGVAMGTKYIYEWQEVESQTLMSPSQDTAPEGLDESNDSDPSDSGGFPLIAIIGGLIGAVIVGIGGYLGLRKRNKKVDNFLSDKPEYDDKHETNIGDGPTEYTFPDGTKQYTFPDGSLREERTDGSIVGKLADGTTFESVNGRINIFNNDGSIITSMPDGTYIERIPSDIGGDQIITTYPDGTTKITNEGSSRVITRTPDGKMKVNEPDGSTRTYDKNERIIEATTPEGDKVVKNSSGTFDLEFADGTKGIVDVKDETINARINSKNGPVEYSFNTKEMIKEIHGPDFSFKETPKELNIKTPDKSLNFKKHDNGTLEYDYSEGNNHKKMRIEKDGNTELNIKNEDGSKVDINKGKDGSLQIKDSQGSNYRFDKSGNIEGNINSENGSITFSDNKAKIKMKDGTEHHLKQLSNGTYTPIN